jgi:hypothetical protein
LEFEGYYQGNIGNMALSVSYPAAFPLRASWSPRFQASLFFMRRDESNQIASKEWNLTV